MEFYQFREMFQKSFKQLAQEATHLFEVEIDKDEFWNLYLDSFPEGMNQVYRERREYDCSCCRQFIKSIGNAVIIKDNVVKTLWDFETGEPTFQPVINALSNYISSRPISNVRVSKFKKVGVDKNFESLENGEVQEWNHFYLELPNKFVSNNGKSEGDIKGDFRDARNVFKRSLDEIAKESILTVLEIIAQNSLYKGEEWKSVLSAFLSHKEKYESLLPKEQENYAWEQSVSTGRALSKIKNHSIGTLLINLSEGMELDLAVKKYESIVAPSNYKRPKAIYTKKMLEDAKKTVKELGYINSLGRRYAELDDITVNNILFANRDSANRMMDEDIFDEMSKEVVLNPKRFSKVEEVSIENFIKNVLPTTSEIELLLENRHSGNMVSLIAPKNKDSKNMFKWGNSFGWAYSGNITDSTIKERVKSAGGNVEGILRFSIQWNDLDYDRNDLDAHCYEPNGNEIYYSNKINHFTTGNLDVDIIDPKSGVPAVENITWLNKDKMEKGLYRFFVRNYDNRGGRQGFRAEIEFDGQIYSFEYNKELRQKEDVHVAEITFNNDGNFSIKEKLPSSLSSRKVWNLNTNQFVPVSIIMFSPNYWNEQEGIGNKHYFIMLKDCINSESPNGFYNEFLKNDLEKHKRVFEALGGKMKVEDSGEQLSGVGFSSTRRNYAFIKVKGRSERVIKIKF